MMFEPDGTSTMLDETPNTEEQLTLARRFIDRHSGLNGDDERLTVMQMLNLEPYQRVLTTSVNGRARVVSSQ